MSKGTGLQAQLDAETRKIVAHHLGTMDIPVDSEVGKFVLQRFWPKWTEHDDIKDIYNVENIFDFLTELSGVA